MNRFPQRTASTWQALDLPDADLRYAPDWLDRDEADALFADLLTGIDWQTHRVRLFGRTLDSPRLSSWIGDPEARYRYSGHTHSPRPWLPALSALRERLDAELGIGTNSVLANLYRDGRDSMGWHADDEPELGRDPVIASVSLGAERRFLLKRRDGAGSSHALPLAHGSLLLMQGATQAFYRHALPRTARPVGPRLNLTFRQIQPVR